MRVLVNPLVLFQTTPDSIFAVPKEITVDVGHLSWYTDLVVVEIGEVLPFVLVVAEDLGQGFVAVLVGVEIGVAAFVGVCTPATGGCRPRRSGCVLGRYLSRRVCLFFPYSVFAKLVVGVCPDFGIAGGLFDFCADELVF